MCLVCSQRADFDAEMEAQALSLLSESGHQICQLRTTPPSLSSTIVAHSDLDAEMQVRVFSLCYFRVLLVRRPTYCNYERHPLVVTRRIRTLMQKWKLGCSRCVILVRYLIADQNIATTNDTPSSTFAAHAGIDAEIKAQVFSLRF